MIFFEFGIFCSIGKCFGCKKVSFLSSKAALGIRIRIRKRIRGFRMYLGLPHPDPLVTSTDPAPLRLRILPSSSKNSKKNLYFFCFVSFFITFNQCSGSACFWPSRIRIRIRSSEVRIRESGSVPKCRGSPTLLKKSRSNCIADSFPDSDSRL
jgi:hypothetical protein